MNRQYSRAATQRLTEPWEEFVGYPYDDKVPKRLIDGVRRYPEYTFERPPIGTVTIGFGHTDAAGNLKITPGLRLTREEAVALEQQDLAPCQRAVNSRLKVDVTQHQFDALVDTYFNCPKAAVAAIALINAGHPEQVPAKLLQYVYSKGEFMQGLVNRRNAEIAWFNHPDDAAPLPAPDPEIVFSPKGERNPPPKSPLSSKTVVAGGSLVAASLSEAADAFNQVLDPIKQVKGSLAELGLFDHLALAAHGPKFMLAIAAAGLAAFVIGDRIYKLRVHHV